MEVSMFAGNLRLLLGAFALLLAHAAPATGDDSVFVISSQTKSNLDQYLRTRQPLAFAVSADGTRSGYVYCEDYGCRNIDYRNQALGLCMEVGGKGCRILAVGQDIKLAYRVDPARNLASLPLPVPDETRTPPCLGKSEAECQAIVVDFEDRRRAVEAKWAAKIDQWRKQLCGPDGAQNNNSRPCKQKMAELAEKKATELAALDEELRKAMAE
jgi:hypothetical protein